MAIWWLHKLVTCLLHLFSYICICISWYCQFVDFYYFYSYYVLQMVCWCFLWKTQKKKKKKQRERERERKGCHMNLCSAWLKVIHVWCCVMEGWKQFSCVIAPCGGALQGAENPFSEKHSILTTFLEKQQILLVSMNFLETPISPSSFFIQSHTFTYIWYPVLSPSLIFPIPNILFVCALLLIPPVHFWISMP